jgi:hypothetical protein
MMVKPDLVLALLSLVAGDLGRILPENQLQIGNRLREHCTFFGMELQICQSLSWSLFKKISVCA